LPASSLLFATETHGIISCKTIYPSVFFRVLPWHRICHSQTE
jgi:hypothetical protein